MPEDEADALTEQIREELRLIEPVVSELLALESQWNGEVVLSVLGYARGRKDFSCFIEIDVAVANTEARWRTLIHEMIHAHSVGLATESYRRFRGWEEGIVENLQRLLRGEALRRIGASLSESVFEQDERTFPFNDYVTAIDMLWRYLAGQNLVPEDAAQFYRELLHLPLKDRADAVADFESRLPASERGTFVQTYLIAHSRLVRG